MSAAEASEGFYMWQRVKKKFDFPAAVDFENIVTKGEITHDEQFLPLPQCFQLHSIIVLIAFDCPDVFKVVYCRFIV